MLQEVLKRCEHSATTVVDLETSGLDWRKNHVCGWVLTFGPAPLDSYYLPVRHQSGGNLLDFRAPATAEEWDGSLHPIEAELIRLLDQPGKTLVFHYAAFDLKFAWRLGMQKLRARFEDTYVNAPLINEWTTSFSLESCCAVAGVQAKKSQLIKDYLCSRFPEAAANSKSAMGQFWRLAGDDPIAVAYAEGDGISTWQLRDWQMKQIADQELGLVHNIESRLIPVLARMTGRGIRIDEERLEFLINEVGQRVEQLMSQFPTDFNVRSPLAVRDWCERHGQTDWPTTPGRVDKQTGERVPQPSFPQSWLETHEAGRQVVSVRKLTTLRDTFLRPMRDEHLWNGRVHTSYHQLRGDDYGTITGRLSSSEPNLQAVSKHDYDIGKLHRSIFVPDEGKTWANADYSQIEPRLLAYYSHAKVLLNGYNANPPVDAHTAVSAAMNRNWERMTEAERKHYRDKIGKRINQTLLTGGGKGVIVQKYGIPLDEVNEAWTNYFRALPEIKPLQKRAAQVFRTRGYVMTLLGRRCRYNGDRDYVALNRLLQGGNADVLKLKLVELDKYLESEGRPIDILNNIHDDVAFQFDGGARAVYDRCLEIMTEFGPGQVIELDVPMAVDTGEGKNWAEASYRGAL